MNHLRGGLGSISNTSAMLEGLFAHAPVALQVYRADGHSLLVNEAFRKLFESEPPPHYNVFADDILERQGFLDLIRRAFAGETVHIPPHWYDPRELRQVPIRQGRCVGIEVTLFPLRQASGAVEHVALCFKEVTAELERQHERDILRETTEALQRSQDELAVTVARMGDAALDHAKRERAEAALSESEARKAAVMEAALDAIVMMDGEGTITEFNPAAERTFGYASADAIGKPLAELLVPPGLRDKHREGLRRYLTTGQGPILGKRIEVPAQRRDGTEFPAEVAVVRIRSDGPAVFTGYIRDITERRQAAETEMLRREKEAAEEASAELEAFSYSVAHDLRAPLRAINGFSSILSAEHAEKLDDEAKDYLSRIASGALRMAQLIDALLSLARLSRTEPRREIVDLSVLAHKAVEQLQASDPNRSVEVLVTDGIVANGDPHLLRAVLENLLGNAWKFTSKREGARVEFGREDLDGVPVYFARDNGVGFNMAHASQLFAPFRRLHTESEFDGSGIGLVTVQRIVRRHGGRVWAEGEENVGATFRFTLSS